MALGIGFGGLARGVSSGIENVRRMDAEDNQEARAASQEARSAQSHQWAAAQESFRQIYDEARLTDFRFKAQEHREGAEFRAGQREHEQNKIDEWGAGAGHRAEQQKHEQNKIDEWNNRAGLRAKQQEIQEKILGDPEIIAELAAIQLKVQRLLAQNQMTKAQSEATTFYRDAVGHAATYFMASLQSGTDDDIKEGIRQFNMTHGGQYKMSDGTLNVEKGTVTITVHDINAGTSETRDYKRSDMLMAIAVSTIGKSLTSKESPTTKEINDAVSHYGDAWSERMDAREWSQEDMVIGRRFQDSFQNAISNLARQHGIIVPSQKLISLTRQYMAAYKKLEADGKMKTREEQAEYFSTLPAIIVKGLAEELGSDGQGKPLDTGGSGATDVTGTGIDTAENTVGKPSYTDPAAPSPTIGKDVSMEEFREKAKEAAKRNEIDGAADYWNIYLEELGKQQWKMADAIGIKKSAMNILMDVTFAAPDAIKKGMKKALNSIIDGFGSADRQTDLKKVRDAQKPVMPPGWQSGIESNSKENQNHQVKSLMDRFQSQAEETGEEVSAIAEEARANRLRTIADEGGDPNNDEILIMIDRAVLGLARRAKAKSVFSGNRPANSDYAKPAQNN